VMLYRSSWGLDFTPMHIRLPHPADLAALPVLLHFTLGFCTMERGRHA